MKASQLKQKYLDFFRSKNHSIIPSASLIPENDPTVLFTTAGMHPLVPFLMGQKHPLGNRLTDVQKCVRTGDIDETGDAVHHTFFEMLGNWSLGDYFKKEAIEWSYEFLTSKDWLGLDPNRIAVSVFAGDDDAPFDQEAYDTWKGLGIPEARIAKLPKKNNWWGPAGQTGPCGPDTEMFYWTGPADKVPESFNDDNDLWVEIWNDVFMQYNKIAECVYEPLQQKNVDTGMGVERVTAILQGYDDNYRSELFWPIIEKIQEMIGEKYADHTRQMRIIADHMRAAVFILGDPRGVTPGNVDQGYILRRFIRRTIRIFHTLGVTEDTCVPLARLIIGMYKDEYTELADNEQRIIEELTAEEEKFRRTIENGLKEFKRITEKMLQHGGKELSGKIAFLLFQSFGFPLEMTEELAAEKGMTVDRKGFDKAYEKHKEASKKGADQKFKGGLAGDDSATVKLHTATHLLNEALRKVISEDIRQKGSNITPERLRFDFNFGRALTDEEKKAVEDEVNRVIQADMPINMEEMSPDQAIKSGAQAEFGARYPD
ncbi:MAG: alanine--tRNA ligase, partial [Nanoarchaeota archaeon]